MNIAVKNLAVEVLRESTADVISRDEIMRKLMANGISNTDILRVLRSVSEDPSVFIKKNPIIYRRSRLLDHLMGDETVGREVAAAVAATKAEMTTFNNITAINDSEVVDATQDPGINRFVPTQSYKHVERRMKPNFPLNIFIWGETGVGKSTAPIHVAKKQGRPLIRVNLSKFSDVDDLFGGLRIVNGDTVFEKGPALIAYEIGAILQLDEVDSADAQFLTELHPLLEKRGYLIKKLKKMVYPKAGFCIIGTANTKGRGDLQGRYIGTGPVNAAFLDRFATGIHYLTPTRSEIKNIIETILPKAPSSIINAISDWYAHIDTAVNAGAVSDHISPRKILDIVEMMMSDGITNPRTTEAHGIILEATNLFDEHVSLAYGELWDAVVNTRN